MTYACPLCKTEIIELEWYFHESHGHIVKRLQYGHTIGTDDLVDDPSPFNMRFLCPECHGTLAESWEQARPIIADMDIYNDVPVTGEMRDDPEAALLSLHDAMEHKLRIPVEPISAAIFYPTNFHADWKTTGQAPVYSFYEGMAMARDGKKPGFGIGGGDAERSYYLEGWIEKRGDKYIAYGTALLND